jgi:hypothetical protein
MEPEYPAEVGFCLAVALDSPEKGASQHEELGLIGRTAEAIREHVHCFAGFLQPLEQPGEVEPPLDMLRLQFKELSVMAHGLPRHRTLRQVISLLQPAFRDASVSRGQAGIGPAVAPTRG